MYFTPNFSGMPGVAVFFGLAAMVYSIAMNLRGQKSGIGQ